MFCSMFIQSFPSTMRSSKIRDDRRHMRQTGVSKVSIHYRHEWKHVLNTSDLLILRRRLGAVMDTDPHAVDGKYHIRSLYFDNSSDKALREKIDGVNMREKFRIRLYNCDPSVIHLEKKSKRSGLGTKYSANLTAEEAGKIVNGDIDWMMDSDDDRRLHQRTVYLPPRKCARHAGLRYPHGTELYRLSQPGCGDHPGGGRTDSDRGQVG